MDLVVAGGRDTRLLFSTTIPYTAQIHKFMEVLLIEKDTLDCILDEHGMLCDMVITLAARLRRKEADEMMTTAEVCDFLHIGHTTLQSLRNNGKIGYLRIEDGSVRYPVGEVIRYMEQNGIHISREAYEE